jgi:type IV pilus assembly protein PilB
MPPIAQLRGRPLGRILIKMGKVTRVQVSEALELQKKKRGPLGQLLIEMGYVEEADVNRALAAQVGMESIKLADIDIDKNVIDMVPAQMAHAYRIVPTEYDRETHTLGVALASPDNFHATDDLKTLMGFNVVARITTEADMNDALNRYYPEEAAATINDIITELSSDEDLAKFQGRGESIDLDELREMAESSPVKKLVNLVTACRPSATRPPTSTSSPLRTNSRCAIASMACCSRWCRRPSTSRWRSHRASRSWRTSTSRSGVCRRTGVSNCWSRAGRWTCVSACSTMFGESVVLRVLDRTQVNLDLTQLGLREEDRGTIKQRINKPHGIIIVTGPTGSGKTTTLYSALKELNTPEVKILTSEDPVEYDIDGLIQCQIKADIGLTFARCLRSFLRQDPDIILVGEILDLETAQISVQSSLTGHLVFSTLHTNDAPSSIARLLDLGMEPFLLTATLEAIIAQRLVRKICENCKEEYTPSEQQLMELGLLPEDIKGRTFFYGKGCDYCNHTGYKGRRGIFETMVLDDELRELIMKHASTNVLRQAARKRGMRSLRESGLLTLYDGITTIEEIVRETLAEEAV